MNKLGRNKTNWLLKQSCVFKDSTIIDPTSIEPSTEIWTDHNEYVGLADLGKRAFNVNFIYKHRLTNLMSINRAMGKPLSKTGCNTVSIGLMKKNKSGMVGLIEVMVHLELVMKLNKEALWIPKKLNINTHLKLRH